MYPLINSLQSKIIYLKTLNASDDLIRIVLKEKLQDHILSVIYNSPKFKDIVFIGGTALRKLHDFQRFSEDLDFSLESQLDYKTLGNIIVNHFESIDFKDVTYSIQQSENVNRLLIKFAILKELNLSTHENENLHVKIEATVGKIYQTEMYAKTFSNIPMVIKSYPIETLMAGKILACINRVFKKGDTNISIKGRDYYDLVWYMEQKIIPNEKVLKDFDGQLSIIKAFKSIDDKVSKISVNDLKLDLINLFENTEYINHWCESFHDLYSNYRKNY